MAVLQGFLCDFVDPLYRRNTTWSLCCAKSCRLSRRHSCYKCFHRSAGVKRLTKGASLLVYSILHITYMVYAPYLQGQTDMRRCTQLKVHLPTTTAHILYTHINHTHFTFTFVCTSILTLRKIGSFIEHQETCRKVVSPCKYATQSVSKSKDIYTVLVHVNVWFTNSMQVQQ